MKILVVGDIVGSPGRTIFARAAARLRAAGRVDAIVANAENAAAGNGITPALAEELLNAGADALTLGDHAWDQKELAPKLDGLPRVLRPANFPPGAPGRGWTVVETPAGPLAVISLLGRVFMKTLADCPFRAADAILKELPPRVRNIVVDFHAEATSEKIALGRHLDGRVSAVLGSHTHVPTADETILPNGTAYQSDLGMTGPHRGCLGRKIEPVLRTYLTGLPAKFEMATDDVRLHAALVETRPDGRAARIERFRLDDGE